MRAPGRYQLQAAIAVVRLNQTVAGAQLGDPVRALSLTTNP